MEGAGEQRGRRRLLHQSTLVEDGDLIAPAPGHRQVMADQQEGAAGFLAELAELLHDLPGHGHIEAGGGFIGNHQGWPQGHRQGNGQPLPHPSAEFMGVAAVALL